MRSKSLLARFWSKVDKQGADQCWNWLASTRQGYGAIYVGDGKVADAHRVSWQLHFSDPSELSVLHKCDNRLCVNPNHLFLGTQRDNVMDCLSKGRLHTPTATRGELNGRAKLSVDDVLAIRNEPRTRGYQARLMKRFGVSNGLISGIVNGNLWRHL